MKELAISVTVRVIGGILLLFDVCSIGVNLITIYWPSPNLRLEVPLHVYLEEVAVTHFVFITIGIGLLLLRKWAALAFSILLLYPAYWSFVGWGWHGVTGHLIGFVYGIPLVLPLIFTVKYWHLFVWRKKKVAATQ